MDTKTKYCKRCDKNLPITGFTKSVGRYDGVQAYCSECMKLYRKEHYAKNRQQYYDRNKVKIEKIRQALIENKSKPCADCGIQYPPYVMQYDHLRDKEYTMAAITRYATWKKFYAELEKCEVVCANCHAERTYRRLG